MSTANHFLNHGFNNKSQPTKGITRRQALKSAAGAVAITSIPFNAWANNSTNEKDKINEALKTDPWLTLNAVLNHLLPASNSGPSALDIQALNYLYNLVHQQPTEQEEIDFIYQGVGWLNGFSQSELKQNFNNLNNVNKEKLLRSISQSQAGQNWLNTLLNYLLEAMLTPPVYGGNPNGIGWQWLEHHSGYPLPEQGTRYYELPGQQSIKIKNLSVSHSTINKKKKEKKA